MYYRGGRSDWSDREEQPHSANKKTFAHLCFTIGFVYRRVEPEECYGGARLVTRLTVTGQNDLPILECQPERTIGELISHSDHTSTVSKRYRVEEQHPQRVIPAHLLRG